MARLSARAHSFAALIGLHGAKAAYDDREKDERPGDDPDKDKNRDAARAEDDPDGKKAAAGDDATMKDCPTCDGDGEDDDGKACKACDGTGKVQADDDGDPAMRRGRRAAAEEDDDKREEGRKAERRRWGHVMAQAIPANKAIAACALLHDTPMAAARIVATLAALPADTAPKAAGIDARMAAAATPVIRSGAPGPDGPSGPKSDAKATAARMADVLAKATGRKPD